jgi:hypothetical protein
MLSGLHRSFVTISAACCDRQARPARKMVESQPSLLVLSRSTFCGCSLLSSVRSATARHYQQKRVSKHTVRALSNVAEDVYEDVTDDDSDEDEEEREPRPMIREWPDPQFIEETLAAFPSKAIADVEEARVSIHPLSAFSK